MHKFNVRALTMHHEMLEILGITSGKWIFGNVREKPLKQFVPEEHHKPQRSHMDADLGLELCIIKFPSEELME